MLDDARPPTPWRLIRRFGQTRKWTRCHDTYTRLGGRQISGGVRGLSGAGITVAYAEARVLLSRCSVFFSWWLMETVENGFEVVVEKQGCCGVVVLRGELDLAGVPAVTAQIEALANGDTEHLVVDSAELSFIDSSGLASLMAAHRTFHGNVAMLNVLPPAERLSGCAERTPFIIG